MGLAISWGQVAAWLGSLGFGVVSAVIPIANAETYVVAAQVSTAHALPLAVAVGLGQSVGKTLLFLGVRGGRELPWVRRHGTDRLRRHGADRPGRSASAVRRQTALLIARLLALIGTKRWGLPIVFLAATVGMPPVYAVSLLAGATTMAVHWFFLTVLAGRLIRFVLLALGAGGAIFLLP